MTLPAYAIGTSSAGLVSLDSIGLPLPKAEAVDYEVYVQNGEGQEVGQGRLVARWRFVVLTAAQVATLEGYASAACYVRTLKMDDTYAAYSSLLILPPRQALKAGMARDYVAEFRKLVAV
jgi:hypothetical protein